MDSSRSQVTIPYLDPALPYQTRQDALRANYGFQCTCRLCSFQGNTEHVPALPSRGTADLGELEAALRTFSLGNISREVRVPTAPGLFETLPRELHVIFQETYLPSLSEIFSKTSHDGPYGDAVDSGLTLLALYIAVYPPNYPQIGAYHHASCLCMHYIFTCRWHWDRHACSRACEDALEPYLHGARCASGSN